MTDLTALAGRVEGLAGAERRLLACLTRRWIKGTGFAHSSVVRDLVDAGLVDHRLHHGRLQIRARAALADMEKDDG